MPICCPSSFFKSKSHIFVALFVYDQLSRLLGSKKIDLNFNQLIISEYLVVQNFLWARLKKYIITHI